MFGPLARFTAQRGGGDHARADSASIIEAVGVSKTYETGASSVAALVDVTFRIARGEMVAVMGPSGCGKTTLLNCLSGLDTVDQGQIWLEGLDLARMRDRARTRYRATRMGFVFQTYNLLPVLSAVENVELPLLVAGTRPDAARKRALRALAAVGLREWASHRPAELSGGQRQRVAIGRALVNDPAIVWADEPTGALDSRASGEIIDLLRDLNQQQGLTIVLVTHDAQVGARCDRILWMRDGRIVDEERPAAAEPLAATTPLVTGARRPVATPAFQVG